MCVCARQLSKNNPLPLSALCLYSAWVWVQSSKGVVSWAVISRRCQVARMKSSLAASSWSSMYSTLASLLKARVNSPMCWKLAPMLLSTPTASHENQSLALCMPSQTTGCENLKTFFVNVAMMKEGHHVTVAICSHR